MPKVTMKTQTLLEVSSPGQAILLNLVEEVTQLKIVYRTVVHRASDKCHIMTNDLNDHLTARSRNREGVVDLRANTPASGAAYDTFATR